MEDNFEENLFRNVKEKRDNKPEILEDHDIDFVIDNHPFFALLTLELLPRKTVLVEASLLCNLEHNVTLLTRLEGGLLQTLAKTLGREPLALNQFTVDGHSGKLTLSPSLPGDILHYYLKDNRGIFLKSVSFLACKPTVQIDARFEGMQGFYNDDSDVLLHLMGQGDLWFSCYGGIAAISVSEEMWFNPDYVVAFEDGLNYEVVENEGLSAEKNRLNMWGGKGRLCRFWGEGQLWLQSRQENMFLNFLQPFLPHLRAFRVN